jgi:Helicase associated domain
MRRSIFISFLTFVLSQLQWNFGLSFSTFGKCIRNRSFVYEHFCSAQFVRTTTTTVWYTESDSNEIIPTGTNDEEVIISAAASILESNKDTTIISPVLRQVYPELIQYKLQYGHPNIPLGCEAGRQCSTLRRLRIQEKLVDSDIELLDTLQFAWHSLEDVYTKQKEFFHDFIQRLQNYASTNDGDLSPPKKYKADPELGAWVTAVRRLYTVNEVDPSHVCILNDIGFQWISSRKCGSKFMQQYRTIQERILSGEERETILKEPDISVWIEAQQLANLSETRKHYMTQIVGTEWMSFGQ